MANPGPVVEKDEAESESVQEAVVKDRESQRPDSDGIDNRSKRSRRRGRIKTSYFPKFPCTTVLGADIDGNFDMEVEVDGERPQPAHLVVMVNGLIGSAQNWRFAAKQFLKKYPRDVVVHCSECNPSMMTFDGVDKMGDRLAAEVKSVVKCHPSVKKISFIGHSLGGLVARYAIAKLYERDLTKELAEANGECKCGSNNHPPEGKSKAKIAGLEPVNFITSATPHLGSRGHKQGYRDTVLFPHNVLHQSHCFVAFTRLKNWQLDRFLGRTGRHLFLTDNENGKPLLLQMVDDTDTNKFMSALQAFHRRVIYANSSSDHLVGWCTSSLRHRNEIPKRGSLSRHEKYQHVINEEIAAPVEVSEVNKPDGGNTIDIEEEMLRKLRKLRWERVDVSFGDSKQRFLAHNTIQVKTYCINSDGADVVQHMVDHFQL